MDLNNFLGAFDEKIGNQLKASGKDDIYKKITDIFKLCSPDFWKDYDNSPTYLFRLLCTDGLRYKGNGFSDLVKIEQTGEVVYSKISRY